MNFGGLIGRKRNLIIALERKRKCILRPAPFSRLRSWPHWRRRRSLNPRERPIRTGPASRSRRRLFRSPPIWAGPQLDLNSQNWRNESDVADLKAQMAQRRVPIADVEAAITDFKAKAGPDADAKLLRAFAAAFADLSQQRSQIIDGLDRIGRRQKALADRIRAENEAVQKSSDQNPAGQAPAGARQSRAAAMGPSHLRRSPSDRHLRLRGADADRTAHRGDRPRGAKGSLAPEPFRRNRPLREKAHSSRSSIFSATYLLLCATFLYHAPQAGSLLSLTMRGCIDSVIQNTITHDSDYVKKMQHTRATRFFRAVAQAGPRRQGEIGLSFSSSNGTP